MVEQSQKSKVKLENDSIFISEITLEDINTYKILNDISENKREEFRKKKKKKFFFLIKNVDYIEKEFKELLKGLESQSKDIKNNLEKEFRELLRNSESQSKDIKNMIEKTLD